MPSLPSHIFSPLLFPCRRRSAQVGATHTKKNKNKACVMVLHAVCDACCTGMQTDPDDVVRADAGAVAAVTDSCPLLSSHSQNINQLEIFGDMSTPPDITSPSVSSRPQLAVCDKNSQLFSNDVPFSSPVLPPSDLQSQPAQTPASPANTLDPSQGLQPPTELFAPFNPATVPSGRTLFVFYINTPHLQAKGETNEREKEQTRERVYRSWRGRGQRWEGGA